MIDGAGGGETLPRHPASKARHLLLGEKAYGAGRELDATLAPLEEAVTFPRHPASDARHLFGKEKACAAVFGPRRAQPVGHCRGDRTRVGILVYITHIPFRHILSVERRRVFALSFEKLYLSTVNIGLCQRKTRAIRQKSHCSSIPDMVKYPRKTGEMSDLAES